MDTIEGVKKIFEYGEELREKIAIFTPEERNNPSIKTTLNYMEIAVGFYLLVKQLTGFERDTPLAEILKRIDMKKDKMLHQT